MARLVFLAVLLAVATYASADEAKLTIKSCTDATAGECKTCDTTTLEYTPDGECHESGENGYKATCKAVAGEEQGKWTLELFTDKKCTTPNTAAYTISSAGKCFDGNSITVNVKKITTATDHTVTLNLCPAANPGTECGEAVTDEACPPKEITVPAAGSECGDTTIDNKYYYTATVAESKLTLTLYTTKGSCTAKKLPVFKGEGMEASETATTKSCTKYQQKLNAESCVEPETTTATTSETTAATADNNNSPDNDGNNTTTSLMGSAAVSAVLALLAAACAVWMM